MKLFLVALLLSAGAFASDERLINGEPAALKDWPASVYIRAGSSACSATIVGPQALISAAHCMRDGGTITFSIGASKYSGRCTHHSDYDYLSWHFLNEAQLSGQPQKLQFAELVNATSDWAMCKLDREVPVGDVPLFETFLRDASLLKVGMKMRMTGYGCTNPGGGGGNDGVFRVGFADVTDLPSGTDNDITMRGGAALCFGDSGGGCYVETAPGVRLYAGVNSRGDIRRMSYNPAVSQPTAQKFFADWRTKNGVKLCGYDLELANCRGLKPPVPPKEVVVQGATVSVKAVLNEKAKYSVEAAKTVLEKAVRDLDSLN